ncbi:OmpA family protein [Caminibacter mediatlanticus]|uniref:Thrombospondin type 3 repeat:OmpA/MotB n=1 Tax=Caminibacter mediatlanticus TB-2 TaxID=391592 RepID=A0AAI9AHX3_9BACT|nr:OmpA family protein [Caminibacter mediatlanticus]EDM23978.1 Thrombospondin type 3 repeat:OmpA/MotB [Caminibacter mediatlanticus TB-2]
MKKYLFFIGISLFFIGCADKPLATNVVDLAGNKKVIGWDDKNNTQKCKPKVVVKEIVKYKELKDSDGDGVPDIKDKCPNTPKNLTVDHNGCPIITTLRINFDFNKWNVKKIYYPQIKKVAEILKANPNLKIEVAGHTDNIGSAKYNLKLSQKRAEAVKKILVNVYHINPNRIVARGYGEKYPLVPNTTSTNRALNRRVEIINITNWKRN